MSSMDWKDQGGSAAQAYDDFLVPAMFAPLADLMVRAAGVQPAMRVLDVACGTGALARALARAAGASGSVTGVDLGQPMLEVARARSGEPGAAPTEFLAGDAAALPVGDATFDVATCQQGLQFFPDRPAALRELRRALRPGGTVAVATWGDIERTPFGALAAALGRHLGEDASNGMRAPFSMTDPDAVAAELREAGFDAVQARTELLATEFATHHGFARRAMATNPLLPLFLAADQDTQQALVEDVIRGLAPIATPDDRLRTTMPTVIAVGRRPG